MSRNQVFKIKSFLHAAVNQSLSGSRTAKVEPLYDFLNNNFSNLVSLMKILAFMSQWYLTTAVIHVSNSYVQSQFVSDTSYEYYPVQQESFIKSTCILEEEITVVMNFWVHVLKMLWKFVKVQMIIALTLTTSFQAGH